MYVLFIRTIDLKLQRSFSGYHFSEFLFSLCMMMFKDEGIYVYEHCSSIFVYRNGTVYRAPESGRIREPI